ncbi:MAG: hypothetical protein PHV60_01465 [bacterium]|nr:hypothetical protein [bacterium]
MNNTVFIIGSGASKEVNLPTGDELKKGISELLDMRFDDWGRTLKSGDYTIVESLKLLVRSSDGRGGDINPYLYEAWHIRDALQQAISIDNFIDAHRDNDKIAICGKLGIVRSILAAEKESLLYLDRVNSVSNINFKPLQNTWYSPFFQLLTENCGKNDLIERLKSITLIIFNYDRCVEHFIYHALQNYYRIKAEEAAERIKNIKIYHPYGSVGSLPWMGTNGAMEYGAQPNPKQLLELYEKIKTYTEGTDPESSEIKEIKKSMCFANKLVFLGFAFHKLNMELISSRLLKKKDVISTIDCFATTYKISDSDKNIIKKQIVELYDKNRNIIINMADLKCTDFFKEFWRSLAF